MTEQDFYHFKPDHHQALLNWHQSLYHNKGDRAALRRCTAPEEVFLTKGFRHMLQQLAGFKT